MDIMDIDVDIDRVLAVVIAAALVVGSVSSRTERYVLFAMVFPQDILPLLLEQLRPDVMTPHVRLVLVQLVYLVCILLVFWFVAFVVMHRVVGCILRLIVGLIGSIVRYLIRRTYTPSPADEQPSPLSKLATNVYGILLGCILVVYCYTLLHYLILLRFPSIPVPSYSTQLVQNPLSQHLRSFLFLIFPRLHVIQLTDLRGLPEILDCIKQVESNCLVRDLCRSCFG